MVLLVPQNKMDFKCTECLLDGTTVLFRPVCSDDRAAILEFHERQSLETRFFRYQYSKGSLTEADLRNFCDIDYYDNIGLVAERERRGKPEIVAVGRFYRLPTRPHTAEVAFVVQDSEQRKGIGTRLLKHLAKLAWQRDIYFFTGEVLRENGRMLSIFTKADPELHYTDADDHTCVVTLSVQEILDRVG